MPGPVKAAALFFLLLLGDAEPARVRAGSMSLLRTRSSLSDLEVTGMVGGLAGHAPGYVQYRELLTLPQQEATITGDENFRALGLREVQVSGVPLEVLRSRLKVAPESDLVSARCADGYEAHFPAEYIAAHHPVLVLEVHGLAPGAGGLQKPAAYPGTYRITQAHFVPSFRVHAYQEHAQEPDELVRLEFTTQARVFGAIAPRGSQAADPEVKAGFLIARQNCFRCHGMRLKDGTQVGGTKAQRSWQLVSRFAHDDPSTFADYIRNPRAVNPRARMPANPEYDGPTLAALTRYFQSTGSGR